MFCFVFDTKNAIAISNFAIFTCSVSRYLYTLGKRHPSPEKKQYPIIDYSVASVMLPVVMMGSLTGVFLNIIFPAILLQGILTALLIYMTYQSYTKGKDMYKKETIKFQQEAEKKRVEEQKARELKEARQQNEFIQEIQTDSQKPSSITDRVLSIYNYDYDKQKVMQTLEIEESKPLTQGLVSSESAVEKEERKLLQAIIEREYTHKQWDKHASCIVTYLILVLTNLLRGNKSLKSIVGIDRCSAVDFLVLAGFYTLF